MAKVVEMWCDRVTAYHEIGLAASTVLYGSLEDLLESQPYTKTSKDYAPVKVMVTVQEDEIDND